jgi:hypothetical protein
VKNKLAEILVEGEKDSLVLRTKSGHFLIRDAGAFFGHREHIPAGNSQCRKGWPRKILVGHECHAVFSG